ncbi:uncharacterized protein LOC128988926 [Macrosteles quadrilineatus]|uniref:uncharacterized protein LOC128988926 n=1 Tax=Macrosteles quadrilineatus TaxID=74068 RepID=UPI0023E0FB84|nr:uncharacterized protein LOC128988926 [Macrosteles quadrilineatus]
MAYNRALLIALYMCALFSIALSQYFDFFGGPHSTGLVGGARDSRGNRGPVVFPPSAPGTETSGVRVGASGYGFVPAPPRGGHGPFAGFNAY